MRKSSGKMVIKMRKKIIPVLLALALAFVLFLLLRPVWNAAETAGKEASARIDKDGASSAIAEIAENAEKVKLLFILLAVSIIFYLPIPCVIFYFIMRRRTRSRKKDDSLVNTGEKASLIPAGSSVLTFDSSGHPEAFEAEQGEHAPVAVDEESGSGMAAAIPAPAGANEGKPEFTGIPTEQDVAGNEGDPSESAQEGKPQQKNKKIHPRKAGRRKEKNDENPAPRKKDRRKKRGNFESGEQSSASERPLQQAAAD